MFANRAKIHKIQANFKSGVNMAIYDGIIFSIKDNIATLTLRDGHNVFSPQFMKEFTSISHSICDNKNIAAITVKSSHPEYFSTGADLKHLYSILGNREQNHKYSQQVVQMFNAYSKIDKPIFVYSRQKAIGGGVYFFTANKNAVAVLDKRASFSFLNPSQSGLIPIAGAPSLIDRIGKENTEILLSGDENGIQIFAKHAIKNGLVNGIKASHDMEIGKTIQDHRKPINGKIAMSTQDIYPQGDAIIYPPVAAMVTEISHMILAAPEKLDERVAELLTENFMSEAGMNSIRKFNERTKIKTI